MATQLNVNVGDENEIQDLVQESTDWMEGIDIFCSNAGIMGEIGLLETSSEKWQSIWENKCLWRMFMQPKQCCHKC